MLGYAFLVLGWLIGLGVFNDLVRQMLGRPVPQLDGGAGSRGGLARYFRYTLDHKVVGIQYLVGMLVYFFTGGLLAMAIRTELLSPAYHVFSPTAYMQVVGEHGTMMMMMMTSVIVGPFGNYLVPIMIGSQAGRVPADRGAVLLAHPVRLPDPAVQLPGRRLPDRLDRLRAAVDPGRRGHGRLRVRVRPDGHLDHPGRLQHHRHGHLLPRARHALGPAADVRLVDAGHRRSCIVLAAPVLVGGMYMILTDRTAQTAFFVDQLGGSSYLYQNLFWFFGHPEVYILALPGFGIVSEIIPVFCRKPLFGYKIAAAGMFGVAILLSFFVWQHHLFDSRINPDMRPLFMLTTELISIPTGFIYLVAMGTFWKAKIRLTVPMLFAIGMYFNFLFGGISGRVPFRRARGHHRARQLLRDGALPLHDHGRPDLRVLRRPLLLAAEGDGHHAEPAARQDPLLDDVRRSSTRPSCRCSRSACWASRAGCSSTRATCRR